MNSDSIDILFFRVLVVGLGGALLKGMVVFIFDIFLIWIYIVDMFLKETPMIQTKVFKSNQSQAVRLSKAVAFPVSVKDVDIAVVGNARVIAPANQIWDSWFDAAPVSDDFMSERNQPPLQIRESLDD